MVYFDIFLLTIVVVYIVDISGIIDSIKWAIGRWLGITVGRLKPFDCSLCMTWWIALIYAIAVGACDIYTIAYIAMLSALSSQISDCISLGRDLISYGINLISQRLWKE